MLGSSPALTRRAQLTVSFPVKRARTVRRQEAAGRSISWPETRGAREHFSRTCGLGFKPPKTSDRCGFFHRFRRSCDVRRRNLVMEVIYYLYELHFSKPSTLNKLPSSTVIHLSGWRGESMIHVLSLRFPPSRSPPNHPRCLNSSFLSRLTVSLRFVLNYVRPNRLGLSKSITYGTMRASETFSLSFGRMFSN